MSKWQDYADWRAERDTTVERDVKRRREGERVKPLGENQKAYLRSLWSNRVTVCTGPAGTGKTYVACGAAAARLREGSVAKIVLARPLLACDEEVGFLKGGLRDKLAPYVAPMFDAFGDFFSPKELRELAEHNAIEVCPLAVMRGRSFRDAFLVLDEAQNATRNQLRMFLTRFGKGCTVAVCGDTSQTDLRCDSPLGEVAQRIADLPGVGVVRLHYCDVARDDLVRLIDERLSPGPLGG